MRTSVKAALAGVAGAGLLLGGAGSLAFWNDTQTEDGGTIESGTLNLLDRECSGWMVDGAVPPRAVDLLGEFLVVPGTKLTKTCTYDIEIEGVLNAELSVNDPDDDGANEDPSILGTELVVDSTFKILEKSGELAPNDTIVPNGKWTFNQEDDGKRLQATIVVELPFQAGVVNNNANSLIGDSKDIVTQVDGTDVTKSVANEALQTFLDDLTVSVKQTPAT